MRKKGGKNGDGKKLQFFPKTQLTKDQIQEEPSGIKSTWVRPSNGQNKGSLTTPHNEMQNAP